MLSQHTMANYITCRAGMVNHMNFIVDIEMEKCIHVALCSLQVIKYSRGRRKLDSVWSHHGANAAAADVFHLDLKMQVNCPVRRSHMNSSVSISVVRCVECGNAARLVARRYVEYWHSSVNMMDIVARRSFSQIVRGDIAFESGVYWL